LARASGRFLLKAVSADIMLIAEAFDRKEKFLV
jgi:hypothetical protein